MKTMYETTDEERQAQKEKWTARKIALSKPITAQQIQYHSQFLKAVSYGAGMCWIYTSKTTGGKSSAYGRFKHNGVMVQAHRFALALKLKCSLWELEGMKCGHAPISICMGGRCCDPNHLRPEETTAVGAWQRSADRKAVGTKPERSLKEKQRMIRLMYPKGLPIGSKLPSYTPVILTDPWQVFVYERLVQGLW